MDEEVGHSRLHRLVKRRGAERAEEKGRLAQDLFTLGLLPSSRGREAERLFMEADGCMVSLQREGKKKRELKVGISYEGWLQVGEGK